MADQPQFSFCAGKDGRSSMRPRRRTRPGVPLGTTLTRYPVFLTQGTEDRTWDAEMAHRLVARMTRAGRAPAAHFFEGEDHIFRAPARNREWELMVDFFGQHLPTGTRS